MNRLLLVIVCLLALFIFIYWLLIKNYTYWKKQNVPYLPNPKLLFGHMLPVITLREGTVAFADKAYKSTSASMIGFFHMNKPGLIIRDPEVIKSVLQTNFLNFRSNVMALNEKRDPIIAKNPFFTDNFELWKEKRIRITNHLSGRKLKYLLVIIQEVSTKMCDFIEQKIEKHTEFYECELKQFFIRCTGEVVANAAFGIEGQSFKDNPDSLAFTRMAEVVLKSNIMNNIKKNLLTFLPEFANFLRLEYLPKHTDAYFRENIKAILKKRKQNNVSPNDYLQFSVESNSGDDLDSIIADVLSFYIDVYATTSSTLAYLFYHLSENPEVQTKLREHIFSKLDNGPITYESLKGLPYLDQVINEALRLSAPLSILMKRCTEKITLIGSDGLECHLIPGCPVFIPVMNLHHDEKYWPDPEKFDPDRFSPENQASIKKFTFLPFGEGPRMCVGMRLGLMLTKIATISILMKYSVIHSSKTKVPLKMEPTAVMMYYEGGVWAKFRKL